MVVHHEFHTLKIRVHIWQNLQPSSALSLLSVIAPHNSANFPSSKERIFMWINDVKFLTWCTIPEPGGTTSMSWKADDPHLRKANLSLFLWNSSSILACTAFSDLATSTWTEWSTTRSAGTWVKIYYVRMKSPWVIWLGQGIRHKPTFSKCKIIQCIFIRSLNNHIMFHCNVTLGVKDKQ